MSRALKIVSPRRNPESRTSGGSASDVISTKISPPSLEAQLSSETDLNLRNRFGLHPVRRRIGREETRKDREKERIALETINKLMVTISHYLSNPLTVLLGRVELLSEASENGGVVREDVKKFTDSCRREIHKIDLIIKVFQNLYEVRYKTYPPGVKMLDVEREIKNRLKEIAPCLTKG
jgi:signal transduction histidine kinase